MTLGLDIKTVASPALIKRGCVNVVGLDSIRAQTGGRWEKLRDAIYARLETLLSHKLGPTDFYFRLGDEAYVVVTPSGDGDDARLCCLKIAYDLHRSLLGNCAITDLSLSRVAGEAQDTLILEPLNRAELAELAVRGGIEDLHRGAAAAVGAAPPITSVANLVMPGNEPEFRFAPVWDARHEAVTSYRLEIQHGAPAKRAAQPTQGAFRNELKIFLIGLAHATTILAAGLRSGARFLTIVPVPYEILSTPAGRMEIASACRNLSGELRPFLAFEISAVPAGVPQSRMGELVCSIKPFGRAAMAQIPIGAPDQIAYQNVGLSALGFELSASATPPGIRDEITKLAAATKRLGLTSFMSGVHNLDVADCAKRAGINYLSGPFIGRGIEVPQAMVRLPWSDLTLHSRGNERRAVG